MDTDSYRLWPKEIEAELLMALPKQLSVWLPGYGLLLLVWLCAMFSCYDMYDYSSPLYGLYFSNFKLSICQSPFVLKMVRFVFAIDSGL